MTQPSLPLNPLLALNPDHAPPPPSLPPPQVRTAANMLGPLLNPALAEYGLVGVFSPHISHLMAESLLVKGGGGGRVSKWDWALIKGGQG